MSSVENRAESVETKRPEVFSYHDYRAFLRDWFEFMKRSRPGFSLRALSRQAALASGYLPMVLGGTRNLSGKAWAKLLPHLGVTSRERSYLLSLHTLADTDSQQVRLEAFDRIQRFRAYREQNPKESEAFAYLSRWFYVAIREMGALPKFRPDPQWIQSRLKTHVPLAEIKQALDFLFKNHFLEAMPGGDVRLPEKNVECVGGIYRMALGQFHREMLTLAARSLENTPSDERNVSGHTLAIPHEGYAQVKAILDDALTKIAGLSFDAAKTENVYHVMLVAFPLTETKKTQEDV